MTRTPTPSVPSTVSHEADSDPHALRMEALSQRVLRHWSVDAWRELFLGAGYATIRFEQAQLTLLAADLPTGVSAEEATLLVQRLGGDSEPTRLAQGMFSFRDPVMALQAALLLQRLSPRRKIRAALSTVECTVALFHLGDRLRRLAVDRDIELTGASVQEAVPGTIVLTAETCALLGDGIHELHDGLVATELDDETVTRASITLAPHASAPMSTFAGLGLS
jgi:hypothetical protein